MPETITDLGRKVKAKYPGQYDDLADDEVGRRVKTKFPGSYDDFTDAPTAPAAFEAGDPRLVNDYSPTQYLGHLAEKFAAPVRNIPSSLGSLYDRVKGAMTGEQAPITGANVVRGLGNAAVGAAKGLVSGPIKMGQAAVAGDASLLAEGAGETTFNTLPAIAALPSARTALNAVTTPDARMARALQLRANTAAASAPLNIPASKTGALMQLGSRAVNPARKVGASINENIAQFMDEGNRVPTTALSAPEQPGVSILPERTAAPAMASRAADHPPLEVNFEPPQPNPTLNRASNIQQIEENLAPSGANHQLMAERVAPTLAENPVLAAAQKHRFNQRLLEEYNNAAAQIHAAEESIPAATTVLQDNIANGISSIIERFRSAGADDVAKVLTHEWDRWAGLPAQIPWKKYLELKRRLGDEMHELGRFRETDSGRAINAAQREMYRMIAEAGPEALKEANANYSTLATAVESAGLSTATGRKISTIGKPKKPTLGGP